ncbi:MAG: anthranilate phosphoribosyltransferase [Chloroflexi bacterium]|nr:MAG: anthranilate phosphoribosyltransferase [Chloroflexota bacterium]
MIRDAIIKVAGGSSLSAEEAAAVMEEIMTGEATEAQIGAFLTALSIKGETPEEISGMAQVMREKSLRVEINVPAVDTCGTGGDGSNTFNISTAAAFVVSAVGVPVAKHGNRALSGGCGSADILEAFGVNVTLGPEAVARCIKEVGIGFMFAPTFHPAMKHAAGPRREIGIRTVFNFLGPLTNPARVSAQVIGLSRGDLGEAVAEALGQLGLKHALVVHGDNGLDELTTASDTTVWEMKNGTVTSYQVVPEDLGLSRCQLEDLQGGTVETNKALFDLALSGKPGPAADTVLLNAAAALVAADRASDLAEGLKLAAPAIESGAARAKVNELAKLSQQLG